MLGFLAFVVVAVMVAALETVTDIALGIKFPSWLKQFVHTVVYMASGAAILSASSWLGLH